MKKLENESKHHTQESQEVSSFPVVDTQLQGTDKQYNKDKREGTNNIKNPQKDTLPWNGL